MAAMMNSRVVAGRPSASPACSARVQAPRAQPLRAAALRSEMQGGFTTAVAARAGATGAAQLLATAPVVAPRAAVAPRQVTVMGNPNTTGIFAPIVRVARGILGQKRFNSIRGQGIALHSQVIRSFCTRIGADNKKVQYLIKKAKKNGEKLGFLA